MTQRDTLISNLKFIALFAAIITFFFTTYGSLNPKIFLTLFVVPLGVYLTYVLLKEFRNRQFRTADATHRTVRLTGCRAQIAAAIMLFVTWLWLVPSMLFLINTDYPEMILPYPPVRDNIIAIGSALIAVMCYYGYLIIYKNEYRYTYPKKSSLTLFGRKWF